MFAYTKEYEGERMLVLLNFSKETVEYDIPEDWSSSFGDHLGNYEGEVTLSKGKVSLRPYEAVAVVL